MELDLDLFTTITFSKKIMIIDEKDRKLTLYRLNSITGVIRDFELRKIIIITQSERKEIDFAELNEDIETITCKIMNALI
jgi:replication initiation and membrane attachment protein DnaB